MIDIKEIEFDLCSKCRFRFKCITNGYTINKLTLRQSYDDVNNGYLEYKYKCGAHISIKYNKSSNEKELIEYGYINPLYSNKNITINMERKLSGE